MKHTTPETILVVDDTDAVLQLLVAILKNARFVVLQANNGTNALRIAASHHGKIDLLLTDLRMPDMSGPDLAKALTLTRPNLHVLLIGGDLSNCDSKWPSLHKPFLAMKLLAEVNAALHPAERPDGRRQFRAGSSDS